MKKSEPKQANQKETPLAVALFVVVIALCGLVYIYFTDLMHTYLQHYYAIWTTVFVSGVFLCVGIYMLIKYLTKALDQRASLLLPLSKKSAGIYAGTTKDKVNLHVSEPARLGHVEILAATGRGKTIGVVEPWTIRDVKNGRSPILIDGKGDPELVDHLADALKKVAPHVELKLFDLGNPSNSFITNPLAHGSAQQITDRIFTAFTFEDPYYRGVQYDIAGRIISLIHEVDKADDAKHGIVTFKRLYELLTNEDALSETLSRSSNDVIKRMLTNFLSESARDRNQKISGLVSQIGPFAIGEVADLVNGSPDLGENYFTLSDLVLTTTEDRMKNKKAAQVVLVYLIPVLKYQDIGHQLGKLILQELGWAVGERASQKGQNWEFTPVFLDEFSALVYRGFENILNKARSSKVALHLSHQSIGDLAMVSHEFAEVINTNTNVKCLLGINDPTTADFFAKHLGTFTEEKLTERAQTKPLFGAKKKTGEVSVREVEAFKVHPNKLKNYTNGWGILHIPTPRGNVTEEIQFARLSEKDLLQE